MTTRHYRYPWWWMENLGDKKDCLQRCLPINQSKNQSMNQSIIAKWSTIIQVTVNHLQSIHLFTINQSIKGSMNLWINQSVNQSIRQYGHSPSQSVSQSIDRSIDRSIDWLTDWLGEWPYWRIDWLTDWLIQRFIDPFIDWLIVNRWIDCKWFTVTWMIVLHLAMIDWFIDWFFDWLIGRHRWRQSFLSPRFSIHHQG